MLPPSEAEAQGLSFVLLEPGSNVSEAEYHGLCTDQVLLPSHYLLIYHLSIVQTGMMMNTPQRD